MICGDCQHDNRDAARFCERCGRALAAACPHCKQEIRPSARFCDGCGAPLGAQPASGYTPRHLADKVLASRSALEGERKQVTVLFADCVGFTSLSTRLDAEELHDLMDGLFEHILGAVHAHGGTVNQFTGDGAMALFGAPVAHEDHARRAVAAALAAQQAISGYASRVRAERRLEIAVRVGLNTGAVVVGKIGDDLRMDYTAQGETVNLAARLQAAAPAGGVLVSEATHRLVEGYFVTEKLAPLELKGIEGRVTAYRVLQPLAGRTRFDRALGQGLTRLVARELELRFLRDCFGRAREGRGQVVSLVGDGGIGKSRLVWELRRSLGETQATCLEAQTLPHAALLPFHIVVQLLEQLLGLGGAPADREGAAQKLDAALERLGEALDWTRAHLRQLLSLPAGAAEGLDDAQRKRRLLEAARAVILAASRSRPLLVIVEDLQWADPSSEEFLGALVDALPAFPVLLLCTYRPGYQPRWAERSAHQRLALAPLSAEETGEMLRHLVEADALPSSTQRLVAERAEGNPLFVEELTSYLRQREEREPSLPEKELPATIHDLLTARIDSLADPVKRALQLMAVMGREFRLGVLQAAAPAGTDLQADLAELVRLEIIRQREIFPEPVYAFSHILVQQTAYQGLLLKTRAQLHRQVGLALEAIANGRTDDVLEELAEHFARSNDQGKALKYLTRAGDRAAGLFAYDEAEAHYRRALELASEGVDRVLVLEKLGDCLYARGDLAGSIAAWQEMAPVLAGAPDARRSAGVHRKLGVAFFAAGERARALENFERGLALLGAERHTIEAARLYQELGRVSFRLGDHARAMEWAERALALGVQIGAPDVVSHAHNTLGVALARAGDFEKGAQAVRRSLDTALAAGLGSVACRAYTNLAVMLAATDPARSAEYCRAGVELAERIGDRLQQSWLYCALAGGHCTLSGDYDEGVKAAETAISLDEQLGQRNHLPIPLILLAQIHGCRGDAEASERHYRKALALAEELGEPQMLVPCYDGLAILAIESGREDDAQAWVAKSRRLQDSTGWTSDTFLLLPFLC